jgi:chemotaxis protein CheD
MIPQSQATAAPQREIKVGMGGLELLQGEGKLRTLLGSCIGLALYDRKHRIGGLAHIVLPASNGVDAPPGKYADTAVPHLIQSIESLGGQMQFVVAKIAGGADMFSGASSRAVGEINVERVEALLREARIAVVGRHCGGNHGRRMEFDVQSGKVTIEIVGGVVAEL